MHIWGTNLQVATWLQLCRFSGNGTGYRVCNEPRIVQRITNMVRWASAAATPLRRLDKT